MQRVELRTPNSGVTHRHRNGEPHACYACASVTSSKLVYRPLNGACVRINRYYLSSTLR